MAGICQAAGRNCVILVPFASALVDAAVRCEHVYLSTIGQEVGPTTATSVFKRAWRFTYNRRVAVDGSMASVVERLSRRLKKPLIVSFDWTERSSIDEAWASFPGFW